MSVNISGRQLAGDAFAPELFRMLDRHGLEPRHLVLEGIETQAQLEQVRTMGFGLGQGFHLGRPCAEDPFFEMLGSSSPAPSSDA